MALRSSVLGFFAGLASAAPHADWRDRVIYQVITDRFDTGGEQKDCPSLFAQEMECTYGTYCGGTFSGVKSKLGYIQDMGFDAIWISPVVTNVRCGYTGYWAKELYKINPLFGGEAGLHDLVAAAHTRGMYVMVDVVFNHMGHDPRDAGCNLADFAAPDAFSAYGPFDQQSDYHPFQENVNWRNWSNVTNWWLSCLPDLDTQNPRVVRHHLEWSNWLIQNFKIDGLRVDTLIYVDRAFWRTLAANLSSHTYVIGEVNAGPCRPEFCPNVSWYASYQTDTEVAVPAHRPRPMLDGILSYPACEILRPAFGMDCFSEMVVPFMPMTELQKRLQEMRGNFTDLSLLGNFVDSHDSSRFLMSRNDPTLLQNSLAFIFGMEGIPIMYYGTEALMDTGRPNPLAVKGYYDPPNMNRWPLWMWEAPDGAVAFKIWLGCLAAFRKTSVHADDKMVDHFVKDRVYAFLRGNALFVTFNVGADVSALRVDQDMAAPASWDPSTSVCDALSATPSCLTTVQFSGRFSRIAKNSTGWWTRDGAPQIWVPTSTRLHVDFM